MCDVFIDLCSGGGGAALGAMLAGLRPRFGLEMDAAIAERYNANIGNHCHVGLIQDFDYSSLSTPFWLHASTPCTTASNANQTTGETALDRVLADAVCRAIRTLVPPRFSLENVAGYRHYDAYKSILATLRECGYAVGEWVLNAADYGVPQTRRRLIVVASRDHQPRKPLPTHQNLKQQQQQSMLILPRWVGWYEAIADLLPSLPDTQPAPWQLARLPKHLRESVLVHPTDMRTMPTIAHGDPSFTVMAGAGANTWAPRALLMAPPHPGTLSQTPDWNSPHPSATILAGASGRAFVVNGMANDRGKSVTALDQDRLIFTVNAQTFARQAVRAFLVGGGNTNTTEARDRIPRFGEQPAFTQTQSSNRDRAFIGRWVKITPRCNARFQSFPDTYTLSGTNTLDCRIIGNAVPPLLMRAVIAANL